MYVQVLNINDNAPEFSQYYETYVCENADYGQVRNNKLPMLEQYVSLSHITCYNMQHNAEY